MTALGWSHGGGQPIIRTETHWIWNDLWGALGNVGSPDRRWGGGRHVGLLWLLLLIGCLWLFSAENLWREVIHISFETMFYRETI